MPTEKKHLDVNAISRDNDLLQERADWLQLAAQGLARAYAPDELEYPDSCIKERNPLYEGR